MIQFHRSPRVQLSTYSIADTGSGPVCPGVRMSSSTLKPVMTDRILPSAPIARKDRRETKLHGQTLVDDYAWLRDKDSPEVTDYLNAENAYADALTADLAPLRDELYEEMLSHIKQTDESAPYREGDWWYY